LPVGKNDRLEAYPTDRQDGYPTSFLSQHRRYTLSRLQVKEKPPDKTLEG
jgi:hypothetical protein